MKRIHKNNIKIQKKIEDKDQWLNAIRNTCCILKTFTQMTILRLIVCDSFIHSFVHKKLHAKSNKSLIMPQKILSESCVYSHIITLMYFTNYYEISLTEKC